MLSSLTDKIIYHGSYMQVAKPDLRFCAEGKDFVVGFYTTTDRNQAIRFAKRVAKMYHSQYGVLNLYRLSTLSGLAIKEFTTTDTEWLRCIVGFRDKRFKVLSKEYLGYDVIIGKIADDDTSRTINAYMAGAYGPINSDVAVNMSVRMLMPERLKNQLVFKSVVSLSRIKFMRSEKICL